MIRGKRISREDKIFNFICRIIHPYNAPRLKSRMSKIVSSHRELALLPEHCLNVYRSRLIARHALVRVPPSLGIEQDVKLGVSSRNQMFPLQCESAIREKHVGKENDSFERNFFFSPSKFLSREEKKRKKE
ncbi:hypothetical protein PUN28_002360 [Cardiocondyla obscurior]|uniref:Ribosomal protein S4 n=1 Tax=Cardiocondyla obscurior TaxID=286306 RepID=A0AAW2GU18_9HYME